MLTKIVDGVEVELSADEEAAVRAEWAASDELAAKNAPKLAIAAIESAQPITQRALREFILTVLSTLHIDPLAKNQDGSYARPKFAAAAQQDAEVQTLRAQIDS